MTETLTESFCERCGTRYTFEPVESRRRSLGAIGRLGRGIKHFVSDPDTSLDEAFAVARSEQEQRASNHALEAFHRTFNFCLTCRQYTCADCWNTVEGRCLTCVPTSASIDAPAARMDTSIPLPFELPRTRVPIVVEGTDPAVSSPWIGSEEEVRGKLGQADAPAADHETGDGLEAIWASSVVEEAGPPATGETAPEEDRAALSDWPFVEATRAAESTNGANWPFSATDPLADADAPSSGDPEAVKLTAVEGVVQEVFEPEAAVGAEPVDGEVVEVSAVEADEAEFVAVGAEEAHELEALEAEASEAEAIEGEAVLEPGDVGPMAEPREVPGAPRTDSGAPQTAPDAEHLAFEPGQNIDDQLAAYERDRASVADSAWTSGDVAPAFELDAIEDESEPFAAEPVAAEGEAEDDVLEPEPIAASASEPEAELDVEPAHDAPLAAAAEPRPGPFEPIPTAIGKPLPASILDGPLAWPDPGVAAAAFEPHWPDIPVPRHRTPEPTPAVLPPLPTPPHAGLRRTGANLPSVDVASAPVPAHSCPSCGLSLSANARFCRRCGTPQQVAAGR